MTVYATQDEALAEAFAESQPGDEVAIHEASCKLTVPAPAEDEACTCTPLVLTIGATA